MNRRKPYAVFSFVARIVLLGALVGSFGAGEGEVDQSPAPVPGGQAAMSSARLQAVQTPSPMSTPEAPDAAATQVAARLTATAEDREKPRFVGVLNGIEFIAEGAPAPPVGACTRDTLRELSPLEAPGAIKMSRLNFEAAHLPGGFVLGPEIASLCEDELVVTGRAYANDDGLPLSITRIAGPPVFDAVAPEVRMEPGAFGGRPGVLVHPITPEHVALVFMYDGETSWIVATPAGVDELVSVAEAVRPVPGLGELGK